MPPRGRPRTWFRAILIVRVSADKSGFSRGKGPQDPRRRELPIWARPQPPSGAGIGGLIPTAQPSGCLRMSPDAGLGYPGTPAGEMKVRDLCAVEGAAGSSSPGEIPGASRTAFRIVTWLFGVTLAAASIRDPLLNSYGKDPGRDAARWTVPERRLPTRSC